MKNIDIKIKHSASSLSEFVKRPLPSDEEVEAFDNYICDEAKENEIKDSLARIYQNDQGEKVDIKTLTVKRGRGFFFNLFSFIIVMFVLGGAAYAGYNFYLKSGAAKQPVSFAFNGPVEVAAGEEFFYSLEYKNEDRVAINNIEIKVKYPESFIFISSEPAPGRNNDTWQIASLDSHRSDMIKIKGKLVGPLDNSNVILADMTYQPQNFSSDFKKSAAKETKINDLGLDITAINSNSVLVNEDNEINIKFKAHDENYLNNFRVSLECPEETQIIGTQPASQAGAGSKNGTTTAAFPLIQAAGSSAWRVSNLGKNENNFTINFKVKEKKQPNIVLKLKFDLPLETTGQPTKYYKFYEKDLSYDVIKSDLNINLIVNGSPLDQPINFGQTLNYSISYSNKGDSLMKDVVIMAILESDFIDWQTFRDQSNGKINLSAGQAGGNTVSWTKEEIPSLAQLASGGAGTIDFSIKAAAADSIKIGKNYQIKNYVKYSIDSKSSDTENQSNIIINKINSDLNLNEQLRYFSDDNLAVGSGPMPPQIGQASSLKVYWSIDNNLHDLNNVQVSFTLPPGLRWDYKNQASVGLLNYDNLSNKIIWQIDKLPTTVYKARAEFNVSLTPAASDRNTIMVILPGTTIIATDSVTGTQITKTLKAKTSKLEDDKMVGGDGVVQ